MLLKLFGCRANNIPPNPNPNPNPNGEKPFILQIIHAGGVVERHYMAIPAASIIDKYPNSVLARPEIFRQPWDAVVPPEEILIPGQKYFVVPLRTVKKLRRRMRNTSNEIPNSLICVDNNNKTRNDLRGKKNSNRKGSRKMIVRFAPSLTVIDETQGFDD